MADLNGFDANQVEPTSNFDPLPAGKYIAAIVESETKPTKNGRGSYLQLTFQVIDGPYKGRMLWAQLNLQNPNTVAVQIARAELSAICRSVGVMAPKDSVELHNLPLQITVKCKKRDDTGEITNEIKGYTKKGAAGNHSTAPPQSAATGATHSEGNSRGNSGGTPPWKR